MSLKIATIEDALDVWEPTPAELNFGCREDKYLSRREYSSRVPPEYAKYEKAVSTIFFEGGSLNGLGIYINDDVDGNKFVDCFKALLSSWDPPHEMKTLTCVLFLAKHTTMKD